MNKGIEMIIEELRKKRFVVEWTDPSVDVICPENEMILLLSWDLRDVLHDIGRKLYNLGMRFHIHTECIESDFPHKVRITYTTLD